MKKEEFNITKLEDIKEQLFHSIFYDRWKLEILYHLSNGAKRYKQLHILISSSEKTLGIKLKELERSHFIKRELFNEMPPRVEYSLSVKAEKLIPILKTLVLWTKNLKG